MSTHRRPAPSRSARPPAPGGKQADRIGDGLLYGVCLLAALLAVVVILLIGYQVVNGASPAISKFGLGFLVNTTWQPNFGVFGAGSLLFGTAVSSFMALLLGAPIAISIGLYLSLLAPAGVRGRRAPGRDAGGDPQRHPRLLGHPGPGPLRPRTHRALAPRHPGLHPALRRPQTTGASLFTASLILTIMVIPIIASISRDLFLAVPRDVQDGASALGATRWEVVRGVVLPSTASGVVAASLLGLGRALGEAIAVTQVIGAGSEIHASLFKTGDTLAARIANQFPGALTEMHKASLFYLGVILLVIGLLSNLFAQWIGRRFGYQGVAAR